MSYLSSSIKEIHEALKAKKITSEELVKESLKKSHEVQKNIIHL